MKRFSILFSAVIIMAAQLLISPSTLAVQVDETGSLGGPKYANYFADEVVMDYNSLGKTYQKTSDAQSDATGDQILLKKDTKEAFYVGFDQPFDGFSVDFQTGSTGGSYIVEYWSGSSWKTLVTETTAKLSNTNGVFHVEWNERPSDWTRKEVSLDNSEDGRTRKTDKIYFARLRLTSDYNANMVIDTIGITNYNLIIDVETELNEELNRATDWWRLNSNGDNNVYQYQREGNLHKIAVSAANGTSYTYDFAVDGYVSETDTVSLNKTQKSRSLKLDYAHRIAGVTPSGAGTNIQSARAGKQYTQCTISGGDAYCPVTITNDPWTAIAYSNTYAPGSGAIQNRESHQDAQKLLQLEFDYPYIVNVRDLQTNESISNATVKTGDELQITCSYIGTGNYACMVPLTETEGKIYIEKTGYETKESTFGSIRDSINDNQSTKTVYLSEEAVEQPEQPEEPETPEQPEQPEQPQNPTGKPDLTVTGVYLDGDNDVRFTIKNTGEADVDENLSVYIALYVDGTQKWGAYTKNTTGDLDEGEDINYNVGQLWNNYQEHTVKVCVDGKGVVDEEVESNNCKSDVLQIEREDGNNGGGMADDPDKNISCSDHFRDTEGHWAEKSICILNSQGIVSGMSETRFDPNGQITRAEFLKIMLMNRGYSPRSIAGVQFTDVNSSDWYHSVVTFAAYKGFVNGYGDGSFRPNDNITRSEAAVIIMRIAGQENWDYDKSDIPFTDVKVWDWYAYAVVLAYDDGIMEGYRGKLFEGDRELSRAEAAVLARRVYYAYYK